MELDDYEKETLFRVFLLALAVILVLGAVYITVFIPSLPSDEIKPPDYHMSPFPPH